LLEQERRRLAAGLAVVLAEQWPALAQQLGPRVPPFIDAALDRAHACGMGAHRHAVRLLNLWCLWGPGFDDKPGFEWAAEVVRDPRRHPAIKIQQLVLQSRALLQRPGASVAVEVFDRADKSMVDAIGLPRVTCWIDQTPPTPEPQVACDMTAFDLALGDQSWRREYRFTGDGAGATATLGPYPAPPQQYRIERPRSTTTAIQIGALAYPLAEGLKAQLQLRCEMNEVCNARTHPAIEVRHPGGIERYAGERQLRWPLHCRPAPGAPGLFAEPPPVQVQLLVDTCGLRTAGAPLGRQEAVLSVWPAEQWLAEFRAHAQPAWEWPSRAQVEEARPPVLRLECDGHPLPIQAWVEDWRQLAPAFKAGIERWWRDIERNALIANPRIHVLPGLMHGSSTWTWGMRESVTPEGSGAFLRVHAEGEWVACATDLSLSGEFSHDGAVARLRVRCVGDTQLPVRILRESASTALAGALGTARTSWRHPFTVELDALSMPGLSTLSLDGGQNFGALCGEAGLRPRPDGNGYQWFCKLWLEPTCLAYTVWDPLRGIQCCSRTIWGQTPLLEWSAG
jgi:hypothetical protein